MNIFNLFSNKKITLEDLTKIRQADWETCEKWYTLLNSWQWPQDLLPEESPTVKFSVTNRRNLLMQAIHDKVGEKYLLRLHNLRLGMTEEQYEDFWNGNHNNDKEAYDRYMDYLETKTKWG